MPENSLPCDIVRAKVDALFAQKGSRCAEKPIESILIRDGYYCGRRFRQEQLEAIWFVDEDQLKVYDDGALIEVIDRISQPADRNLAA